MGWYKTGTVSVSVGSAVVAGVGTDFVTNVAPGFAFMGSDMVPHEVLSVDSATQITLATNYSGPAMSGAAYGIFQTQGIIASLSSQVATLISSFGSIRNITDFINAGANATASATAAAASQTAAAASASTAGASATNATASAATATAQAGVATTQATNAGNSATAASASATNAANSQSSAATQATNAANSASAAATSATSAASNAGKAYSGIATFSTNTTFTTSVLGQLVRGTAASITGTLPPVASCPNGSKINLFADVATGTITIKANASENMDSGFLSANVFTLSAGESVELVSDTTKWTVNDYSGIGAIKSQIGNGGAMAFKNRIINGSMRVQQYINPRVTADAMLPIDRMRASISGVITGGVGTGSTTLPSAMGGNNNVYIQCDAQKTSLAAGDFFGVVQAVEGNNIADFLLGTPTAKTFTLSFSAIASAAGTVVPVSFRNAATNRSYVTTVTVGTTAQKFSVTVPGDTSGTWRNDNGVGMWVGFYGAAGTTNNAPSLNTWATGGYLSHSSASNIFDTVGRYVIFTDIQLELGTVATPFEVRSPQQELQLCRRYYNIWGQGQYAVNGGARSLNINFPMSATMRATPSVSNGLVPGNYIGSPPGSGQWAFVEPGVAYTAYPGAFATSGNLATPDSVSVVAYYSPGFGPYPPANAVVGPNLYVTASAEF
ncbi:hypothetical protein [Collimonas humicola]|uniref:hypothetical protein n=1 Tax=Collimonas humicola TaxID=2825886 RepID=UPI001B8B2F5C|nr:hypothetical protein [Collimonas humicola]